MKISTWLKITAFVNFFTGFFLIAYAASHLYEMEMLITAAIGFAFLGLGILGLQAEDAQKDSEKRLERYEKLEKLIKLR